MDSWLKAAREQAAKLGEDIQKQAILLADDSGQNGMHEALFREGPLGFELDGVYVSIVDPDGQAEQLGVHPGDKLVSIAGYTIPENPKKESVKRWLDEMVRPGMLQFFSEVPKASGPISSAAVPKEVDAAESGLLAFDDESWRENTLPTDIAEDPAPTPSVSEPPESLTGDARLRAEVYAARDEVRSLERELEDCKAECQELRHFAIEKDRAREAMECREKVLEEEVERLRETIHNLKTEQHNSVRSVEVDLRSSQDRIDELEKQLAQAAQEKSDLEGLVQEAVSRGMTAETEADIARKEVCKLEACHVGEVASLQARYDRQVCDLQRRIEELETEKAQAEEASKVPKKPEAGDEANAEKDAEDEEFPRDPSPSGADRNFDAVEDVQELHSRIHVLENRCIALQKKLNARPVVYQSPTRRRSASMTRSTGFVGLLKDILEPLLLDFTERLLKNDAFLWVFYGHLCVLYVIAASCYAQTGLSSTTVDVDLHSKQALRGDSAG